MNLVQIKHSRQLFLLIASVSVVIFVPQSSFAQTYDAVLTLEPLPSVVQTGQDIVFSGRLTTTDGYVVSGATIYIKDDIDFGSDDILGSVETDEDGWFDAVWTAQERSSGSWDFYAVYEGSDDIDDARSRTYSVTVSNYANSSSDTNYSSDIPTKIILDSLSSSAYTGNSLTFTGKLYANGKPLPNAPVMIYEDDPLTTDDRLAYGKTDANGNFKLTWTVSAGLIEKDFDIYAVFDGDSLYDRARSPNQTVSILKYGGDIRLDPIPSSAKIGEPITFSGSLSLDEHSSEGAIVYIKDEDLLNPDDLLATAYVDANGKFSARWFATDVDEDYEADIYAVFEGNGNFYRLTTCDANPTRSVGGSCSDTIPMYISGTYVPSSSPSKPISGEYIEGFYSLDFTQRPLVVLVPSPDSYSETSRHIVSVKEGILMWKSYLDRSHGGNWDVDFDVVSKDDMFFSKKPDIVVNLVTPEIESGCNTDFYGYAMISENPSKPIQTFVCVIFNDQERNAEAISATSAHEFIHAMGLGHAFNKDKDMMCSIEDGKETCNTYGKSKTPSTLNLAGVVQIYGLDGFRSPNNDVNYKTKFIESDSYDQPSVLENNFQSKQELDTDNDDFVKEQNQNECNYGETLTNGYCISDELAGFIFAENEQTKTSKTTVEKKIPAPFVDITKDPKSYVKRYVTEEHYKKWFEENYPDYAFHEALGITKSQFDSLSSEVKNTNSKIQDKTHPVENTSQENQCDYGTHLENGVCVIDKQDTITEKQEKNVFTEFFNMLKSWFS